MRLAKLLCLLALLLPTSAALAQTGKIAGQVTDAATGDPLPGVAVMIVGTTQGSATDVDGYYTILNVRPGTYDVQASYVGYTNAIQSGVRVNIDLTVTVNFTLQEATVGLGEVIVQAERPIVQPDVSANVASLSAEDFENLPVAGVSQVLDLQAGIEPGLTIRGGGASEVAFVVDGLNMRTGRSSQPLTNISYTSVEEVQVQTGGFDAKYGNVRSGVVNVATKEPPRDRYTFDGIFRYTPIQDKAFNQLGQLGECDFESGDLSSTCDNFWVRPMLDPAVNMTGTANGAWDIYTQHQYMPWAGWEAAATAQQAQGFDVSADDLVDYFKHTHRKDNSIQVPDYDADFTIGGPLIPGVSQKLGGLRFLASYRGTQTAYAIPQTRDAYRDNTFQLKLVTNLTQAIKVTGFGLTTIQRGQSDCQDCANIQMWGGGLPSYPWWGAAQELNDSGDNDRADAIYSDARFAIANIDHNILGGTLTHTLSSKTFYEVTLQRLSSKYRSHFSNLRDASFVCPANGIGPDGSECEPGAFQGRMYTDDHGALSDIGQQGLDAGIVQCFGGTSDLNGDGITQPYCVGEEPLGFSGRGNNLLSGESMGSHWDKTRDTSDVQVWTGRFDLTSQLNRFLQLQTGAELIYSNYEMHYADVNLALIGPEPESDFPWQESPIQGGAYAQTKLEFKGMIANIGARLDYFDANTSWWTYSAYDPALAKRVDFLNENLPKEAVKAQVSVSPRLGISFPISTNSKLYFNYGHFRQMLNPADIFGIQQSKNGGINAIGNPGAPMPKTVAYELGFDQNLFNTFLLRISGFYRDVKDQSRGVEYFSLGNEVNYTRNEPWNYEDIRGAEISLTKNRGRYFQGFANFTYTQSKSGNFGYDEFHESTTDMQKWLQTATDYRLSLPVAEPYARVSLVFLSPKGYGPTLAGAHPLGDWRLSLLGEWRQGQAFTWFGVGSNKWVRNNVRYRDYTNVDLRLTKQLDTPAGDVQLFADVSNLLNTRHLYRETAFVAGIWTDFNDYMTSLHLDKDVFGQLPEGQSAPYVNIPGNDRPGTYRKSGIAYQPIQGAQTIPDGAPDADEATKWVWAQDTGKYYRWQDGNWAEVPSGDLKKALDDRAYIDMPNISFTTFLNPRRVTLGIRYTF